MFGEINKVLLEAIVERGFGQHGKTLDINFLQGPKDNIPVRVNFSGQHGIVGNVRISNSGHGLLGEFELDRTNEFINFCIKENTRFYPCLGFRFDSEKDVENGVIKRFEITEVSLCTCPNNDPNIQPIDLGTHPQKQIKINSIMELTPELINTLWAELPVEKKRILLEVARELEKAERKFPKWPTDLLHASAIVNEESGELTRAALQVTYEPALNSNNAAELKKEALHTAAMGVRFLLNMSKMWAQPKLPD